MKKLLKIALRILKFIFATVICILLTYSVLFSIAGTVAIISAYNFVMKPIKEVKALRSVNPQESAFMRLYREELVRDGQPDTFLHRFVPLDSISKNLRTSVIASEDDGFYTHPGIDLEAMIQAAAYNRSQGEVKRGGSTITQQVAKNLFLSKERSFERKIREVAYSILMERYLGKDRILELYLNYAQWGKNIFGCEAASMEYFKKSSANLTRNESAKLAAILAMPSKISPHNTKSVFLNKRIAVIANNLYMHKIIGDSAYFNLTGKLPAPKEDSSGSSGTGKKEQTISENRKTF
jgi:monofunctional biosynthetic peptidoglycan transglycosylase